MKRILTAGAIVACAASVSPAPAAPPPPPATPAPVLVDEVVAVVDDTWIFRTELTARMRPYLAKLSKVPAERATQLDQLTKEAVSQMIDDVLLMRECARLKLDVTDAEIDKALEQIASKNGLSTKQLDEQVAAQGIRRDEYRDDIRRQIYTAKWVQIVVVPKIDRKQAKDEAAFGAAIEAKHREALAALRKRAYVEVRL